MSQTKQPKQKKSSTVAAPPSRNVIPAASFWICATLALVTFLAFVPILQNEFVNYDDPDYVYANAHVTSGLSGQNIQWALTTGFASNWHPLTWMSHMLDCDLFGQKAGAHHLVSLLFHITNAILLLFVLRFLTNALWSSAAVAAAFALHPCHVESVAWISERKDVLSGFFGLLTIWSYAAYASRKQTAQPASSPRLYYALSLFLFGLGLMSKPMLVTWPFVLLLLDLWPLKRFELTRQGLEILPRLVIEKIPFFALSVGSSIVTFLVQRTGGAVSKGISFGARLENAVVAYARYIGDFFWPSDLAVLYPHPGTWSWWHILISCALLTVVTVAVIVFARSRPYLLVGWLWFLGTLVPVIGLVQVGVQSMADRYTYLPFIGLFVMVVWLLNELVSRFSVAPQPTSPTFTPAVATISGFLVIVFCGAAYASHEQARLWQNSETLFRHTARVTKNNYLAYNNLGYYLSNRGQTEEAIENYRRAIAIKQDYEDAWNNLGYALAAQKHYPEAIQCYEQALRIKPDHIEVHNNLGNALSDAGRVDEAVPHYEFVLAHKPDHADAHNNYGVVLAMKGQYAQAIQHFHLALKYKPGYASAHSNLGNTYAMQRKFDEALIEYQQSLVLNSNDPQAYNNLGNVYSELGKLDQAVTNYQSALKLNPDNPEAQFNLGMAQLRRGDRTDAVNHFQEALRLKPDYAEARNQLGQLTNSPGQPR